MRTLTKTGVLSLSVPERIQLVEDIWDTIAEIPDEGELEARAFTPRRADTKLVSLCRA